MEIDAHDLFEPTNSEVKFVLVKVSSLGYRESQIPKTEHGTPTEIIVNICKLNGLAAARIKMMSIFLV